METLELQLDRIRASTDEDYIKANIRRLCKDGVAGQPLREVQRAAIQVGRELTHLLTDSFQRELDTVEQGCR